jgi:hypothetical protein
MDEPRAAEILRSLAAGTDPATGSALSDVRVLQAPDVVCALFLAADSLDSRPRQARARAHQPRNAGKPWSRDEDDRLLESFDGGATIEMLTVAHERTRAGIEARLVKHNRLELEQAPAARIR